MQVRRCARGLFPLTALVVLSCGDQGPGTFSVLVFSRTAGFRHASIPAAITTVRSLGESRSFSVEATEEPAAFSDQNLARFNVVVFLCTTGDVLDAGQQQAFETFIRRGGGFVGVHSAADTEYDWAWYGGLVGAYFASHPSIQAATVRVTDRDHPSTSSSVIPAVTTRTDEWYNFRDNPRSRVSVLATLDETTYAGGTMGADHPISWYQSYDGGRAFYTAMGHTEESYGEPAFVEHLAGGILWASGANR